MADLARALMGGSARALNAHSHGLRAETRQSAGRLEEGRGVALDFTPEIEGDVLGLERRRLIGRVAVDRHPPAWDSGVMVDPGDFRRILVSVVANAFWFKAEEHIALSDRQRAILVPNITEDRRREEERLRSRVPRVHRLDAETAGGRIAEGEQCRDDVWSLIPQQPHACGCSASAKGQSDERRPGHSSGVPRRGGPTRAA